MTDTTAQIKSAESENDDVRDDARQILNRARDTLGTIEAEVDALNDTLIEFILALPHQDDAAMLADAVGAAANELFADLDRRFDELGRELAVSDDDEGED